jgi:uncharacterized membrane protein
VNDWRGTLKIAGKILFATPFLVSGVGHLVSTDFFLKIMPPYLPYPRELVLISGGFEIVLGIMLLVPKTSRLAAWGLVALLIAVFPANLYMYQHRELFPIPETVLLLRLPLQALLILWAYAYTRGPKPNRAEPSRANPLTTELFADEPPDRVRLDLDRTRPRGFRRFGRASAAGVRADGSLRDSGRRRVDDPGP